MTEQDFPTFPSPFVTNLIRERPLALPRSVCTSSVGPVDGADECGLPLVWRPGEGWLHVPRGAMFALLCAACGVPCTLQGASFCPTCGERLHPALRHVARPARRNHLPAEELLPILRAMGEEDG